MQELHSNCCNAKLITHNGEEGTNCYICTKCGKACDAQEPEQTDFFKILLTLTWIFSWFIGIWTLDIRWFLTGLFLLILRKILNEN